VAESSSSFSSRVPITSFMSFTVVFTPLTEV
jgi:hypothetical protein